MNRERTDGVLAAIDQAVEERCAHCGDTLTPSSGSAWFCSALCQRAWAAGHAGVEQLPGWDQDISGFQRDAMRSGPEHPRQPAAGVPYPVYGMTLHVETQEQADALGPEWVMSGRTTAGAVMSAPIGTEVPAIFNEPREVEREAPMVSIATDGTWHPLGYVTADGLNATWTEASEPAEAWGGTHPIRTSWEMTFDLQFVSTGAVEIMRQLVERAEP